MNCASHKGSLQQIPLQQLPFANEAKTPFHLQSNLGLICFKYEENSLPTNFEIGILPEDLQGKTAKISKLVDEENIPFF